MSIRKKDLLPSSSSRAIISKEEDITLEKTHSDNKYPSQDYLSILEENYPYCTPIILNITALNYHIERMFKNENDYLLILSPYLQIAKTLEAILSMSIAKVTIIYRKEKNNEEDLNKIKTALPNVTFLPADNLHAKVYISSRYFIIASLNLYEFSQLNNFELGVLLHNENDNFLANQLKDYIKVFFKVNNFDFSILDVFSKEYTIGDLYQKLKSRCGITSINDKQFRELNIYIGNELKTVKNLKENEGETFSYYTKITKDMYDYGIENIKLPL